MFTAAVSSAGAVAERRRAPPRAPPITARLPPLSPAPPGFVLAPISRSTNAPPPPLPIDVIVVVAVDSGIGIGILTVRIAIDRPEEDVLAVVAPGVTNTPPDTTTLETCIPFRPPCRP